MKTVWIISIILCVAALSVAGCTTTTTPTSTPTPMPMPTQQTPTPGAVTAIPGNASVTPAPSTPASANATVSIKGFAFNPAEVTIAQGGTVTWTNNDNNAHTVKFSDSESGQLNNGGTYSKIFDVKGEFPYHCGNHPYMTGKVIVV